MSRKTGYAGLSVITAVAAVLLQLGTAGASITLDADCRSMKDDEMHACPYEAYACEAFIIDECKMKCNDGEGGAFWHQCEKKIE